VIYNDTHTYISAMCYCLVWYVQESKLDDCLQSLATNIAPVYQRVAPDSYYNQVSCIHLMWTYLLHVLHRLDTVRLITKEQTF